MSEEIKFELLSCPECDLRSRHDIAQDYYIQFINRVDSMFRWSGLPDTIPEYILERYLKLIGWCGIGISPEGADHAGKLVCFYGGLGETPDMYYRPTAIILANPVLGSKTYKIGKDVVWAKNDSCAKGIAPLLSRYAHLLASNDISINIAQVTTRMPFVLTGETDSEIESAKQYVKDVESGKIGVVKSTGFNKGLEPKPATVDNAGGTIKSLIELHQYLKAQFYNDLGIGSNFNMKRERMTNAEVEYNSPSLLPLVDEMLKFRKQICKDVHEMFPEQNWNVELNSAWILEHENQVLDVEAKRTEDSRDLESEDNNE